MAGIEQYLQNIMSARYGADVRQSIHDAIQQTYLDAKDNAISNDETLITANNYLEKLPDVDTAEANTIFRLNFEGGSTSIPSNLPFTSWPGNMAMLLTLGGIENWGGTYREQLLIGTGYIFFRYRGCYWYPWYNLTNIGLALITKKSLDSEETIPDFNDAPSNTILKFNYAKGSTNIPAHTPYGSAGWQSSTMALLITIKGVDNSVLKDNLDTPYRTQIFIDTNSIWFRLRGGERWNDWHNIGASECAIVVRVESGDSLLEKAIEARNMKASKLIVGPGEYDIIQEYKDHYGDSYFDDYVDYNTDDPFDRGLWFTNIDVEFSPGSKVIAHYTGGRSEVTINFSAIAIGTNVSIDGLTLDASNLRYGIHPDFSSTRDNIDINDTGYIIFKNCDLKHKSGSNQQTIGAGFGRHEKWLIENCIFRSDANARVFRIHNSGNELAESKLIMKDCYFDGPGFATFNYYGPSQNITEVLVSNCSYINPPVVTAESSSYTNENIMMTSWNNEQRSV